EEHLRQERAQVEQERQRRRKQIRRLAAGVCIAAGLAALFGVMGAWALYQRHLARVSAREAKESLRVACKGVDDLMTEVAAVDLGDMPQMALVRTDLLHKAQKAYEQLGRIADPNEPELLWVSARSRGRLGEILAMLGQYREAEASYRDAVGRLEPLAKA